MIEYIQNALTHFVCGFVVGWWGYWIWMKLKYRRYCNRIDRAVEKQIEITEAVEWGTKND